jgi:hypothetical protein
MRAWYGGVDGGCEVRHDILEDLSDRLFVHRILRSTYGAPTHPACAVAWEKQDTWRRGAKDELRRVMDASDEQRITERVSGVPLWRLATHDRPHKRASCNEPIPGASGMSTRSQHMVQRCDYIVASTDDQEHVCAEKEYNSPTARPCICMHQPEGDHGVVALIAVLAEMVVHQAVGTSSRDGQVEQEAA